MFADDNLTYKNECGIFSNVDIPADSVILEFRGDIFEKNDIPDAFIEQDYYIQIGKNTYIGASGWFDDYVNHSCNPNCKVLVVGNRAFLISIYIIKAGTQITFDYSTTSTEDNWKMNCQCNSYTCREVISSYKTVDEETRKKYEEMRIIPTYVRESVK